MSLRMRRRLEKLELARLGRMRRITVYWVDPVSGVRQLIAGGEEGGEVGEVPSLTVGAR